jgi:hypothetical protein
MVSTGRHLISLCCAVALIAACSSASTDGGAVTEVSATAFIPMTRPLPCDPLDERACLLPWPNDGFTVPDSGTATGRRLSIAGDSTPVDTHGAHVDVSKLNTADGFSPNSAIITAVPGLDPVASHLPAKGHSGESLRPDSPIVLLDSVTGVRLPYWVEATGSALLTIHPAAPLPAAHEIIIALRELKDHTGRTIHRADAFQAAIDGTPEPPERAEPLRVMLDRLALAHVPADQDLFLAWNFTVASRAPLSSGPPTRSYADPVDAAIAEQLRASTP